MTNKSSSEITQSKLDELAKFWTRMLGCIIHDLTSPLAVVRMAGNNVREVLPDLISGYQQAVDHQLVSSPMKKKYLTALESHILTATNTNVTEMFDFLKLSYQLCGKLFSDAPETSLLSARATVESALAQYPFADDRLRACIQLDLDYDFQFDCVPVFVECLFAQLLYHAIRAIPELKNGDVRISTAVNDGVNVICFKYNSTMEESTFARIFDQFYVKKVDGIEDVEPGLGFCKLALLQRGGDLVCNLLGDQTEFLVVLG